MPACFETVFIDFLEGRTGSVLPCPRPGSGLGFTPPAVAEEGGGGGGAEEGEFGDRLVAKPHRLRLGYSVTPVLHR